MKNPINSKLNALQRQGWFTNEKNIHVIVDGQFGSTGKGVAAGLIAECFHGQIDLVTTNAAPNSGHTAYLYGEKIVNKQIPIATTVIGKLCKELNGVLTYINSGAVIDINTLISEINPHDEIVVSPTASVILEADVRADVETVKNIASTGKGTGPAIAKKVMRDGYSIMRDHVLDPRLRPYIESGQLRVHELTPIGMEDDRILIEVSQGYSLGIHSSFYPHVTSRECTVAQALADARLPVQMVNRVLACYRTFPIRVGNTEGSSGDHYADQREITWNTLEQKPELTTVTGRIRRVFTWSDQQFIESLLVNRPDVIFINFMNYITELSDEAREQLGGLTSDGFKDHVRALANKTLGKDDRIILWGYGPNSHDVELDDEWSGHTW